MALIQCPECGKQISSLAEACIYCGYPLNKDFSNSQFEQNLFYQVRLLDRGDHRFEIAMKVSDFFNIDIKKALKIVGGWQPVVGTHLTREDSATLVSEISEVGGTAIVEPEGTNVDGKVRCPRCGSTSITTGQRGYKLLIGFLGSSKAVNRCGNCGYTWEP